MRIVIIDDEINIIEMLKSLIDWEGLGLSLAGTATDGISATQLIQQERPDIVITDIRIPGCDGLELIRRCHEMGIPAQFIIISGFKQFDYAQNAIRYGVKDYLLKPIKQTELNATLASLTQSLSKNRQQEASETQQEELLSFSQARLQGSFLTTFLSDPDSVGESLEDINQNYLLSFAPGLFRVVICKIDTLSLKEDTDQDSYFFDSLCEKVSSDFHALVEPHCHVILSSQSGSRITFFFNYDVAQQAHMEQAISSAFEELYRYVIKFKGTEVFVGVGDEVSCPGEFRHSLESAQNAIMQRILHKSGQVLYPSSEPVPDIQEIFTPTEQRTMKRNIECFDLDALEQQCINLFTTAERLGIQNAQFYWNLCHSISFYFQSMLVSMHIMDDSERLEMDAALEEALDGCSTLRQFRSSFTGHIRAQVSKYYDTQNPSENIAVMIAKKYIAAHYAEKILLKDIAEQVYLNPIYFSISFKRTTGVNFVDYLNEYRIERAKEQLKSVKYSISEIAQNVGFSNVRYFTKIFKRYVGLTPATYRKNYGNTNS